MCQGLGRLRPRQRVAEEANFAAVSPLGHGKAPTPPKDGLLPNRVSPRVTTRPRPPPNITVDASHGMATQLASVPGDDAKDLGLPSIWPTANTSVDDLKRSA